MDSTIRQLLQGGTVIPAHPLALTKQRRLDERRQRALTRYYLAAGNRQILCLCFLSSSPNPHKVLPRSSNESLRLIVFAWVCEHRRSAAAPRSCDVRKNPGQ